MNIKKYNKQLAYRQLPKAAKRQHTVKKGNISSLTSSDLDMLNTMSKRLSEQAKELD